MTTDITELFDEVVKNVSKNLKILYPDGKGGIVTIENPNLNYIFGNSQYIKDQLDLYSKSSDQSKEKYPLIALFCPVNESRDNPDYFSKGKVALIIACSTRKDWSNEERRVMSFQNILRPIYNRLLDVLLEDQRFDWDFDDKIKHSYTENYSYGRYGAYAEGGEAVSEPIDAINIRSMEIKVRNSNCERI